MYLVPLNVIPADQVASSQRARQTPPARLRRKQRLGSQARPRSRAWGGVGFLHPCISLARLGAPGRAAAELRKAGPHHPPHQERANSLTSPTPASGRHSAVLCALSAGRLSARSTHPTAITRASFMDSIRSAIPRPKRHHGSVSIGAAPGTSPADPVAWRPVWAGYRMGTEIANRWLVTVRSGTAKSPRGAARTFVNPPASGTANISSLPPRSMNGK